MLNSVAQTDFQRKPKLNEEKLKRLLTEYPGTPVLSSFHEAGQHLRTRRRWERDHDRNVIMHQSPRAIVLWEHERPLWTISLDPDTREETWKANHKIVLEPVTVFSIDQTRPIRKHARTKAIELYWELFGRYSSTQYKIALLENGKWDSWRGKIKEHELKGHYLGERQFALRMGKWTRVIGIDLDLHSGSRDVFTQQLRILLDHFWGKKTWHIQVKREDAAGIHLIRLFNQRKYTNEAVRQLRKEVCELDRQHSELAQLAIENDMKPLSKVEIKPTQSVGLRLPLAPGRTMLLDRPLEMVTYRENTEPDIVGYINWVNKALKGQADYMVKEEVFDYIVGRLCPLQKEEERIEPIIVPPQKTSGHAPSEPDTPVATTASVQPPKYGGEGHFKGMKGRSWQLITNAWLGGMQPDSLNHWIRQLSLYSPFKFSDQDDAIDAIEAFIDELSDWSFSDRLSSGNRSAVSVIVRRDVKLAFNGWPDQPNPKKSAKKLESVWDRWRSTGRDPFDKSTWTASVQASCYKDVELEEDFDWTDEELKQLAKIATLLSTDLNTAASAVKHLVRLIQFHPEVPRTWIQALLIDFGIAARSKKLDKPKKLIDKLIELGWIYIPVKHNKGRCRQYGLAELRMKFPQMTLEDDPVDDVFAVHDNYIDLRELNREFMERQDEIFA